MPHFEQEIYQYVLFVGTITVIEAEFLTLRPIGELHRPRSTVIHYDWNLTKRIFHRYFNLFSLEKN